MVNILMSTYNGEKYLIEQLDSIFAQTYQDFVLYVRDDGSTDQTVAILKNYRGKLRTPEQMVICQERNVGFCRSFFELLRMSEDGEYWTFSDQDDVWYPDKLLHAVEWMENGNSQIPRMYHSGIVFADEDMNILHKYEIKRYKFCFQKSITSNVFYGFSMMINRTLREELLKCDSERIFYHDWFIGMIVTGFGEYCFSDQIDAAHRIHKSNTSAVSLRSKLPLLRKLFSGDMFYQRQAMEYKRVYWSKLSKADKRVLELFDPKTDKIRKSITKAFFPKRWNPRLFEECGTRFLMLIGKI